MRVAYEDYQSINTERLWNSFVSDDEQIMEYLYGREYTQSKKVSFAGNYKKPSREEIFFSALEESLVIIRLLKERPLSEIYKIKESLKSKLYVAKNDSARDKIQSYIGFIDKEFFD